MMTRWWNVLTLPWVKSTTSAVRAPATGNRVRQQRRYRQRGRAGDTYWKIDDRWGLRGGLQYDTRLNSVSLGNGVVEYRRTPSAWCS